MSRAFVKEQDDLPEAMPERPVSTAPNVVTARGLRLIEGEIEASRRLLAQGQNAQDKAAIARASRDLRYWMLRRSTAQVMEAPAKPATVAFGTRVSILRHDGRKQVFSLVGEDEADPPKGLIAYTTPLARALIGKGPGDIAEISGGEVEVLKVEKA